MTSSPRSPRRRRAIAGALGLFVLVLTGCAKDAPLDVFKPKGDAARTINRLQVPVFLAAGVVGIIVFVAIGYVMVKFRQRPGHDDVPRQIHGAPKLEVT